jgi:hypothetical protein
MTFDEWWNGEAAKGQWVGEYETDAESNARIGWEAALSHSSETTSGSGETPRTDARQLADATRHSSDALDNAYELARQLERELADALLDAALAQSGHAGRPIAQPRQ